jgi:hypothetical protein
MWDRAKTVEALWSLWNLIWDHLAKWGVTAMVVAMIAAIGAFLYSIGSLINSFGLAGWSVAVFATLLLIVTMVGLIAWAVGQVRKLRTPKPSAQTKPATAAEPRVDHQAEFQQSLQKIRVENTEAIRAVEGLLGKLEDGIASLRAKTDSDLNLTKQSLVMINTSLRARDALEIIREADEVAVDLASRLMKGNEVGFDQSGSWFLNYEAWARRIGQIDSVVSQWQDGFRKFLDVRQPDYESFHGPAPPEHIKGQPQNERRFQTLSIVHIRYWGERRQVISYFEAKIRDNTV